MLLSSYQYYLSNFRTRCIHVFFFKIRYQIASLSKYFFMQHLPVFVLKTELYIQYIQKFKKFINARMFYLLIKTSTLFVKSVFQLIFNLCCINSCNLTYRSNLIKRIINFSLASLYRFFMNSVIYYFSL